MYVYLYMYTDIYTGIYCLALAAFPQPKLQIPWAKRHMHRMEISGFAFLACSYLRVSIDLSIHRIIYLDMYLYSSIHTYYLYLYIYIDTHSMS